MKLIVLLIIAILQPMSIMAETIKTSDKETTIVEKCIDGYVFLVVTSGTEVFRLRGVAVTQVLVSGAPRTNVPQPKECK